ncbi:hypothetical protein B0H13DRAFT_1630814, partial [Mycena leptocephala]
MPLFSSCSGFQIYGGSFNNIAGDVNLHITQATIGHNNDPLTALECGLTEGPTSDAFHDSAERYPQPKCHPETRTELLDKLWNWTCLVCEKCPRMIWLYGPAGAGKSAVMQSFCQKLESEGCLGGTFFFKRGHPSRGNGNKLL